MAVFLMGVSGCEHIFLTTEYPTCYLLPVNSLDGVWQSRLPNSVLSLVKLKEWDQSSFSIARRSKCNYF